MVEEEVTLDIYGEEHDLFKLQKPSEEVILI